MHNKSIGEPLELKPADTIFLETFKSKFSYLKHGSLNKVLTNLKLKSKISLLLVIFSNQNDISSANEILLVRKLNKLSMYAKSRKSYVSQKRWQMTMERKDKHNWQKMRT